MTVTESYAVYLELLNGCECEEFALPLYLQLSDGYEECAVLRLPPSALHSSSTPTRTSP